MGNFNVTLIKYFRTLQFEQDGYSGDIYFICKNKYQKQW